MPTLTLSTPKYRKHACGQAVVTLDGRDFYLGEYGSPLSRNEYDRVVGEWLANGRRLPAPASGSITVNECIVAYWRHAELHYRRDGKPTSEIVVLKSCMRPLRRLYGHVAVSQFGPLSLSALQEEMIRLGWVRGSINKHVHRITRMFRWCASKQMIPASIPAALETVFALQKDRTDAKESEPVRPVAAERIEPVRQAVASQVRAMIDLQLLTGMRSGEVCIMRARDIERDGSKWTYRPARHKTQHHGHDRAIPLGPKAQALLQPFLGADPDAYLFSPTAAIAERRAARHAARKTPLGYGNSPGTNRVRSPKRKAAHRYTVVSYRRAIERGCEKAFGMPIAYQWRKGDTPDVRREKAAKRKAWHEANCWHPHQLRHTFATNCRREGHSIEEISPALGHKSIPVTELYAEKSLEAARKIMAAVG